MGRESATGAAYRQELRLSRRSHWAGFGTECVTSAAARLVLRTIDSGGESRPPGAPIAGDYVGHDAVPACASSIRRRQRIPVLRANGIR
jgi:hypothetical protein